MSASAALPAGGSASVEAFRRLLESAAAAGPAESPVVLTERLVGAERADLLRRCAIPHDFDVALLAWLGGLDDTQAEERYAEFTELSLMQIGETALSLHERWRKPLWSWWLADAQRAAFTAHSERLVAWFTRPPSPTGEDPARRRRMFHLLGCRRADGLDEFERLMRAARHHHRLSECSLLLQLVREYGPVLAADEAARVAYHEGKLAIDRREWERARQVLRAVAGTPQAAPLLRLHAEVRAAHALRQLRRFDEARETLERALALTDANPSVARSTWRVLYELGEVERDLGHVDQAARTLADALQRAADDGRADVAGIHNSLGTVQLRMRDVDAAIASFDASLAALRAQGDGLRIGGVLNNLGIAQLERCNWAAASTAFAASLDTKRAAGDLVGQATTLLNLGRAQAAQGLADEARRSVAEAEALFQRAGDGPGRALAQQALQRLAGAREPHAEPTHRLPWWAWLLLVLGLLLTVVTVFARGI